VGIIHLGRSWTSLVLGGLRRGSRGRFGRPAPAYDANREEREQKDGDHPGADERRAHVGVDCATVRADPDDRDDQRQTGRTEQGEAKGPPGSQLAEPEERGQPADNDEECKEERRQRQTGRGEEAVQVEVDSG
jgi:hypothetical protein